MGIKLMTETQKQSWWGYHTIIDASECDYELITNYTNVYNFAKQLVKDIDMVAYGEPQIVDFGSGDKAGFTLVQLIETSNICAHFCNGSGDAYIDVFSCKPYDRDIVRDQIIQFFKPRQITINYIERQA